MGSSRVGFVGAGRMGLPMVERLAAAGHEQVVYARRPESAADLDRLGVRPTSELAEVSAGAGLLLLCVFVTSRCPRSPSRWPPPSRMGPVFASHVTAGRRCCGRWPTASAPSRWWTRRSAAPLTTSPQAV